MPAVVVEVMVAAPAVKWLRERRAIEADRDSRKRSIGPSASIHEERVEVNEQ